MRRKILLFTEVTVSETRDWPGVSVLIGSHVHSLKITAAISISFSHTSGSEQRNKECVLMAHGLTNPRFFCNFMYTDAVFSQTFYYNTFQHQSVKYILQVADSQLVITKMEYPVLDFIRKRTRCHRFVLPLRRCPTML